MKIRDLADLFDKEAAITLRKKRGSKMTTSLLIETGNIPRFLVAREL